MPPGQGTPLDLNRPSTPRHLRDLMDSKIAHVPLLQRQDASLYEPKDQQEVHQDTAEAGTNQKIPQARSPDKKVWWQDDKEENPEHDITQETG